MPHGGHVTVETSNCTVDDAFVAAHPGAAAGRYVKLAVSDTGAGLDDQTRAQLFEPFVGTSPRGDLAGGRQLRVASVYGFVKQSGGLVSVDSVPGAGTTFAVYLPQTSSVAAATRTRQRVG